MDWLRGKRRDSARLALQTGLAGALAYLAEGLYGGGQSFLAVISAALVLDVNSDGTFKQARARIIATLLGSALGLAVLALFGDLAIWVPLAVVLALMAGIAAYKPAYSYGIVAACALALGASEDRWSVAMDRSVAIAIGAAVGFGVAFLVWPESAQARTRRKVCAALRQCRKLLDSSIEAVASPEQADLDEHHHAFSEKIHQAHLAASAISLGGEEDSNLYPELVDRVDRLWHALIILDRVNTRTEEEQLTMSDSTREAVQWLRETARRGLGTVADFEPVDEACIDELDDGLARAREAVDLERRREQSSNGEELRISALVFGLAETAGNLCEISRSIANILGEEQPAGREAAARG